MLKTTLVFILFSIITFSSAQIFGPDRKHIQLGLSENRIDLGGEIELSWDVNYYRRGLLITLNDSIIEPKGSLVLKPDTTTTYSLSIETRQGKKARRSRRINVNLPELVRYAATDSARYGAPVDISWRFENVEKAWVNEAPVSLMGDTVFALKGDFPFVLKAENKFGESVITKDTIRAWHEYKLFSPGSDTSFVYTISGIPIAVHWEMDGVTQLQINGELIDSTHSSKDFTVYHPTMVSSQAITHDGQIINKELEIRTRKVKVSELNLINILTWENISTVNLRNHFEPVKRFTPYRIGWNVDGVVHVEFDGERYPTRYQFKDQALDDKIHHLTLHYYDEDATMQVDTIEIPLKIQERPFFNGNLASFEELDDRLLYLEVVSVDYSDYPDKTRLKVVAINEDGEFVSGLTSHQSTGPFKRIVEEHHGSKSIINNLNVKEINENNSTVAPQDILLVFDYSGSMHPHINYLEEFVRHMIINKHPEDRMAILKFDELISGISPFFNEPDSIIKAFNKYTINDLGGWTALYAAGDSALLAFQEQASENPRKVVLFTDGFENASMRYGKSLSTNAAGLTRRSRSAEIPINVVSFGYNVNFEALNLLSDFSHGHYYPVYHLEGITLAIGELFHSSRQYYEVDYTARNRYEGPKNISLIYDDNKGGEGLSMKRATNNDDYGDLSVIDLPPLHDSIRIVLNRNRLEALAAPQNLVNFDFNRKFIRRSDVNHIEEYAQMLKEDPSLKALIIGHSDLIGSKDYCDELSKERANAVKANLIDLSIEPSRLFTVGMGQRTPMWTSEENEIQAFENRRVEILLVRSR